MKTEIRNYLLLIFTIVLLVNTGANGKWTVKNNGSHALTINLKARAVVLGPSITLGDIGSIEVADQKLKVKLMTMKVGDAPPPGESFEISLNYIKRLLESAGFEKYVGKLKGPRSIRVITAQVEIDKAFVREEFA